MTAQSFLNARWVRISKKCIHAQMLCLFKGVKMSKNVHFTNNIFGYIGKKVCMILHLFQNFLAAQGAQNLLAFALIHRLKGLQVCIKKLFIFF